MRFALTPLAEKITEAIHGSDRTQIPELRERLAGTEGLVEMQQRELDRLAEAERFHRQLSETTSG